MKISKGFQRYRVDMISNSQFFKGDLFCKKIVGGVMVLVFCVLLDDVLYLYKVS